jgi:hypothetical protein
MAGFDSLVYGENEHISIARLPDMRERTLVVTSFSRGRAGDVLVPHTDAAAIAHPSRGRNHEPLSTRL